MHRNRLVSCCFLLLLPWLNAHADSRDLGGGFSDHGVATPLSQHRGMVATVDGDGRDVMLIWLYDHRGGYALLMVDAVTGKSEQFPTPYPWSGDGPFASLLSSRNKYYTQFGGHFSEFDPVKRAFTFVSKTAPQMAMSLTEADDGTIWAASYPNSGLVSFDPATRVFKDRRSLNAENWRQYPRSVAVDDAGWVYVGIGSTAAQVLVVVPGSDEFRPALAGPERRPGYAALFRSTDGKVYARVPGEAADTWREFHRGAARSVRLTTTPPRKPLIAGDQGLFHARFPSGRRAASCDTVARTLVVEEPRAGETRTVPFDYTSEGAHVVAVAVAPDGTISGGTAFPMRMFSYAPARDAWQNWPAHGQFNTVVRQGARFFVGGYPHGFLLEWDPASAWVQTGKGNANSNPRFLTECEPAINRPHDLLALADGRNLVLAGTPGYGLTGGGVLFWDRATQARTLVEHTAILPQQSTFSLVELPGGKFLGGTTTAAGTGGESKVRVAELYVMDVATKTVEWHAAVFPGVQTYTDLTAGPRGLVYGFADRTKFFVFDPAQRRVIHQQDVGAIHGGVITGQGPRAFVAGRNGRVTVLFTQGIAQIEPETFAVTWLAAAPLPITSGGDAFEGRVYFAAGSHLCSYRLPE
ncbi:hypothetical protein [Horticoccus sp. 23ND18S-11]|uniref:hypothetical protein n=1 Tax=Horticoccus sp. 23ND18S-11 TaxID=3391832 RepID=UPI0039C9EB4B